MIYDSAICEGLQNVQNFFLSAKFIILILDEHLLEMKSSKYDYKLFNTT